MLEPPGVAGRKARGARAPIGPACEWVKVNATNNSGLPGRLPPGRRFHWLPWCLFATRRIDWSVRGGSATFISRARAAVRHTPALSGCRCRVGVTMRDPCEGPGEKEELEEGAAATGHPAEVLEAKCSDVDSDSDLETEGAYGWGSGWGRSGRETPSSQQRLQPCALCAILLATSGVLPSQHTSTTMGSEAKILPESVKRAVPP